MAKKLNKEWIDVDEVIQSIKSNQAFTKTTGYFEDKILKQDSFRSEIDRLRRDYNVEVTPSSDDWDFLTTTRIEDLDLEKEIAVLCSNYGLDGLGFTRTIFHFILHDEIKYPFGPDSSLCKVLDNGTTADAARPISILVSPYAAKRDILNFIDSIYDLQIEPLQRRYAKSNVRIGEFRRTEQATRRRNEFIYNNRELPIKKIATLVADNFSEDLDDGHIGKIISLEKAERKQL